jgi:hypothetical protein
MAEAREAFISSNNSASSLVGLIDLRTIIVQVCLVNMQQSVPSNMVSLGISSSTGRSAPRKDVEALGGAYFHQSAPDMREMRRGRWCWRTRDIGSRFCMTELDPRSTQFVPPKYKNPIKAGGVLQSLVIEMDCASGVVAAMRANTYCALIGSPDRSEAIPNIEGRNN